MLEEAVAGHPHALAGRDAEPPRTPLPSRERPHLRPARADTADPRLRLRPEGHRASPPGSATATAPSSPTRKKSSGSATPAEAGLVAGGMKVCWGPDEHQARAPPAHRLWPNEQLPGELAQILPTPAHFEQASELVSEDMVAEAVPCGPDLDLHLRRSALPRRRVRRALHPADRPRPRTLLRDLRQRDPAALQQRHLNTHLSHSMRTDATLLPTPSPPGRRGAPGSQLTLTSVSEAARRLLRGATPVAQPMISKRGPAQRGAPGASDHARRDQGSVRGTVWA